jgi:tetratricopeptide (TPR) repeat protein
MEDVAAPADASGASAAAAAAAAPVSHFDRCLAAGAAYKETGNAAFKAGDLQRALGQYARVSGCVGGLEVPAMFSQSGELGLLAQGLRDRPPPPSESQLAALHALQDSVALNRAACYAKPGALQDWRKVHELASTVLARDNRNAKALFRRGQALLQLQNSAAGAGGGGSGAVEAALADLTAAATILPSDAGINQLLAQAKRQMAELEKAEERKLRAQFANMFK